MQVRYIGQIPQVSRDSSQREMDANSASHSSVSLMLSCQFCCQSGYLSLMQRCSNTERGSLSTAYRAAPETKLADLVLELRLSRAFRSVTRRRTQRRNPQRQRGLLQGEIYIQVGKMRGIDVSHKVVQVFTGPFEPKI